jgi:phosphinothricin acetyltransferase
MIVRPAATPDLPAITHIANSLVETTTIEWSETPHTVADREAWFRDHAAAGNPVLVAVDGAEMVGWAAYGDFRNSTRWPG